MKRFLALFDRYWLLAFLLLSVSWLFAPALHHAHFGNLDIVSTYEGVGERWAWIFRTCDILGATVLGAAVWRYRVWFRDRLLALALTSISVLAAIDAVFNIGCHATACQPLELFSASVHDVESSVLAVIVFASAVAVFRRTRSWLSILLMVVQLVMAVIALSDLLPHAQLIVVQFTYQLTIVAWAAWLMVGFAPDRRTSKSVEKHVRRLFMWMTLLCGVLVLVAATTRHHMFGELLPGVQVPWLANHGVISGLLLLYIARQVGKGQRRAAIILAVVLSTFVLIYALYRPYPELLGFSLLLLILLWYYSNAFVRNVGLPPLVSRLKDLAVVVAGILAAASLVLGLAFVTGKQHQLFRSVSRAYQRPINVIARQRDRLPERYENQLQNVGDTLGVGLVALLAWTLFRPSGKPDPSDSAERERAARLLDRHSNSSEDYFKLWPQDKRYFFAGDGKGFVAYKVAGAVAFALADPIAPNSQRAALAAAFVEFCRQHGWRACFLLVQESSRELYGPELKLFRIGSSAVINVKHFTQATLREKWWRWQANRARKAGYAYEAVQPPYDSALIAELRAVSDQWLTRDGRREQGFALGYFDEYYLQHCPLHILRDQHGMLVAFANELPVRQARQRTIDLMRFVPEVDGAMSVLMMYALQRWAQEGTVKTFDLGFVPLAGLDTTLSKIARYLAGSRFSSAGLEQFKNKFEPDWRPNYIAYDGDALDLVVVLSAMDGALRFPGKDA